MRVAVMQPYFLPYLGYFQLLKSVDTFVFFDDVYFIKRGWINRNSILVQGKACRFTIPLDKASQNLSIQDIRLHVDEYPRWREKFLKTVEQTYRTAPYFKQGFMLIKNLLHEESFTIAELAISSIRMIADYLDINTKILRSSSLDYQREGNGEYKIVSICNLLQASTYVNAIGGINLYDQRSFSDIILVSKP